MAKLPVLFSAIAAAVVGLNCVGSAEEFDVGKFEYQQGCAACHGVDGKGAGPVAVLLKVPPADLAVLAKKNNGVFPFNSAYDVIDGRKVVIAHGTREMPIWGNRYLLEAHRPASQNAGEPHVNLSFDPETIARMRILAVIDYLNRLQEK